MVPSTSIGEQDVTITETSTANDLRTERFATIPLLVAATLAACAWTCCAAADEDSPSLPKVRISDDGHHLVLAGSRKTFVPWGFNYLGEFGSLVKDSWEEDWSGLEQDFREMRKLGGNVVRIHLQFGTYMKGPEEFDQPQLDRLKRLLDLSGEVGLYLDVTGLSCYRLDDIPAWLPCLSVSVKVPSPLSTSVEKLWSPAASS